MNNNVILSCAITGAGETTEKSPYVPVTPKEIADSAIKAAKAGATIAHLHVRDPKTGKLSHDVNLFKETVERIREADTDVIINITAGGGGDWIPSEADPTKGGDGTDMQTPEERHEPVGLLFPEICTLDCGSVNFGGQVYISPANWLREQAKLIQAAGVKPELECFDTGHIRFANQLVKEGLIDGDPMFQFCLGIPWGAEADAETLAYMKSRVPENATWAAFGIGRMQMPMVAESVLQGGNVRVGLEDNLYLKKGTLATNEQLVDKAVGIIQSLGADVMSPTDARAFLNLKDPNGKKE
ncbi:3-keto-5-aminohexanoate cleavage protein [Virgibacillus dakarensis]|uniref:3-keto-5-aminohexanoate cleavage protein n=1 Tax=Lentibacillus populi TaxID=1827502 RepID=A0A9W5TWQ0_9BACI|nr:MULTISPECIES: 3-keto-5-aminohexanoate cleavage protein [Bacillaceae]MBT2217270.1 3-keto-5-aminohexanoate cleavage protein [Virgibacillus dakarensis]MTW86204.1 3-keto-5-aminohexanoate cleavage protein [Virgibacillus dakarensis]GGB38435.1 3-keto-5-aminohexanoate cleavage protein [Lentibacillus populi]